MKIKKNLHTAHNTKEQSRCCELDCTNVHFVLNNVKVREILLEILYEYTAKRRNTSINKMKRFE